MDDQTICMFCKHCRTVRRDDGIGLACGLTGFRVEANWTCGCGEKFGLLRPKDQRKEGKA